MVISKEEFQFLLRAAHDGVVMMQRHWEGQRIDSVREFRINQIRNDWLSINAITAKYCKK